MADRLEERAYNDGVLNTTSGWLLSQSQYQRISITHHSAQIES